MEFPVRVPLDVQIESARGVRVIALRGAVPYADNVRDDPEFFRRVFFSVDRPTKPISNVSMAAAMFIRFTLKAMRIGSASAPTDLPIRFLLRLMAR